MSFTSWVTQDITPLDACNETKDANFKLILQPLIEKIEFNFAVVTATQATPNSWTS